jgi:hypothetical protein
MLHAMRWLTIAILVLSTPSPLSAQTADGIVARIRLALERPDPAIRGLDSGDALRMSEREMLGVPVFEPLAGAPKFGPFGFVAPQLRGEVVRLALPVGDYLSHPMRSLAAANQRRQVQAAHQRVEAELRALKKIAPKP